MMQALAPDPFAPLSSAESAAPEVAASREEVAPVIPVPEDAPTSQSS